VVLPALPAFVWFVQMADADVGYVVGGKQTDRVFRLYRTADAGRSWRDVTPNNGTAHPVGPPTAVGRRIVFFPSKLHGAIVIERSTDGGRSWTASAPIHDRRGGGPGQVVVLDARHLYLAIGEGAAAGSSAQSLWRSGDDGRTWQFVSRTQATGPSRGALPFSCDKTGYGFATLRLGWAGGACAGGAAFFYRTDDGGRRWRSVQLAGLGACACSVSSPRFFGRRGVFTVEGFPDAGPQRVIDRIYWTSDGGLHWRFTVPPAGRIGPQSLVDGRTAWLAGTPRGNIRARFNRVYVTTDAGRHWRVATLPFDAQNYQLDAVSGTDAYAVGGPSLRASLFRTSDGGRTWRRVH
jgi:photosystem II stability/assembly factor-like uncharacterized protein